MFENLIPKICNNQTLQLIATAALVALILSKFYLIMDWIIQ